MEIHFVDGNGADFHLPVNPEEIRITRDKALETILILSLGEFDLPAGERVKEIAFSSFFPAVYDSGYCNYSNLPDPQEAMNRLTRMMNDKKPVRLIITDTAINVLVMLSAHHSTFRGGEPGDVYFDVTARTWRDMKVHTLNSAGSGTSSTDSSRTDTKPKAKTYTVKSGDSLSKIAKLELGSSAKWQQIYSLNKGTIGSDPNKLKPGQKLVLPS
ncbi:LysM peptidoglycan-binding domain-containing protein [Paenibacillus apis]|uniref:LysM domain-containing protein n=1 Tax=Paenibacillus apis TaxID=1792174 RepID=A0A920CHG0_9BACL|nr:LysM peptidoglycan-binding domain-containing protein [Paenibacillus apis]GIO40391.1 hypothetical protein J41TS4_01490 [Paenibacillus apis]